LNALEGGGGALAVASGMAAIDYAVSALAQTGDHALAKHYLKDKLIPGILSFELSGGQAAARALYDALQLFLRLVNIGDNKSFECLQVVALPGLLLERLQGDAGSKEVFGIGSASTTPRSARFRRA